MKTLEQMEGALAQKLDEYRIEARKGANGQTLHYLEGWEVIQTANEIFGFFGWSRETVHTQILHDPVLIEDPQNPERGKVVAAYEARVRITVYVGDRTITRDGSGAARGFAKTAGEALENALKSAETDAMKRALVTFGDQFGLTLYDKEKRNVERHEPQRQIEGNGPAPIDHGFNAPAQDSPRASISQRAVAHLRGNGATRVKGLPV